MAETHAIDRQTAPATRLASFLRRNYRVLLIGTILLLTALAWTNRFVQDDAFISFRYARHLVEGNGLVWNPGDRIEGYTNFLWVLIVSLPMYVGWDPVSFTYGVGMALFALSLLFTARLSFDTLGSKPLSLLVVVLLGTNYTFSAYATGGLETQLQVCLLLACTCLTYRIVQGRRWRPGWLAGLSVLAAAALMTRLDSAILLFVLALVVLVALYQETFPWPQKGAVLAWLAGPVLVLIGGWFAWKLSYYGDVLPNTFYAKTGSATPLAQGVYYGYLFLTSYWLVPFLFLLAVALKRLLTSDLWIATLALMMLLWCAYVVKVGGDFMEFRFFDPVLPLIAILLVWIACVFVRQRAVSIALVLVVLGGSLHHVRTFETANRFISVQNSDRGFVESVAALHDHVARPEEQWIGVGQVLGDLFYDDHSDVTIATTAAGAVPYFSRLKTIDMLGLNDRWIARHGQPFDVTPGHQRITTLAYLLEQEVHLVVGHPWVEPIRHTRQVYTLDDLKIFRLMDATIHNTPAHAQVIEIPLDDRYKVSVLYLIQHDAVDRVIATRGFKTFPLIELTYR